jgi:hypothetical protein
MHYVTRICHRMRKHKFDVTHADELLMDKEPVPPEHEKLCVDVSHHGGAGMHYVTRKYHQMQKHKFIVSCPEAFLWNP